MADVPSWRTEPQRLATRWFAYRQVAPDAAPLFHAAGEQVPSQRSGRWHREGEGYAQYLALEPAGAWAEFIRYERIRAKVRAVENIRRLWLVYVEETDIADLSTFERYADCGLDPRIAVGRHDDAQALADDLRRAGFRGVVSVNAALPQSTNLTLFGERYEKVLRSRVDRWANPDPQIRLACSLVAEGGPPAELIPETCFVGMKHDGYRDYLQLRSLPQPKDPP